MPKSPWIMLLVLLGVSGCATARPGWRWASVSHTRDVAFSEEKSADEEEWDDEEQVICEDDSFCEEESDCEVETTSHQSFWRKLIPWDEEEDTRPYDERLEEFNEKFRNNG